MEENNKKVVLIPLGASPYQEISVPGGTQVISVILHDKIPHLVAVGGLGSTTVTINIAMVRLGYSLKYAPNYNYIGTLQVLSTGSPHYFFQY